MGASCGENTQYVHAGHLNIMTGGPALRTQSFEFHFDSPSSSAVHDDPPLSPKLLYSPNYTLNYPLHGESALIPSRYAERDYTGDDVNHTDKDNYDAPPSVSRTKHDSNEGRKHIKLRSLLERRDVKQLPALTNYYNYRNYKMNATQQVPAKRGSYSAPSSPSSLYLNYRARHSINNRHNYDNYRPDSTGAASPSETKNSQKKSSIWAFMFDILRKSPSPRAERAVHQGDNDNPDDYWPNHGVIGNKPDHCSVIGAADEAGLSAVERDNAATASGGEASIKHSIRLNQRIAHYRAAGAAGEARFNLKIKQSISLINGGATEAAKGPTFNDRVDQSIDHYRGEAAMINGFESPGQSTCSVVTSVSNSPGHADNEVSCANQWKMSRSAAISPARAMAGEEDGAFTRRRAPMSPHARHYEQQRARMEELKRKSFLPYRRSLLGACVPHWFTLAHNHHPHVVY